MNCVLTMLETLAQYPELKKNNFIVRQAYFREQLGEANMAVLDALEQSEHEECTITGYPETDPLLAPKARAAGHAVPDTLPQ